MSKNLNVKQIERMVMIGLVLIFLFLMARQCVKSENGEKMQPISQIEETPTTTPANNSNPTTITQPVTTTGRRDTVVQTQYVQRPTALFVWADGLKVRTEPYLTSAIVAELSLNAQVSFQGETSSFKQKIRLDNIDYDERWLKVKTTDGKVGWVYGGGIRLYQK